MRKAFFDADALEIQVKPQTNLRRRTWVNFEKVRPTYYVMIVVVTRTFTHERVLAVRYILVATTSVGFALLQWPVSVCTC